MSVGGRGDGGAIDHLGERLGGGESFHVMTLRDLLGHMGIEVIHAYEFDTGQLRINPRVFPSNMSNTNDTDSYITHNFKMDSSAA